MTDNINREILLRVIAGELRHAIHDHGVITPDKIGSAANRIAGGVSGLLNGYAPRPQKKRQVRSANAKAVAVIKGTLKSIPQALARTDSKYHANIIESATKRLLSEFSKYELIEVRK